MVCGRWDLFLKAYKRVWPVCQKLETDFSYSLPPTPHIQHSVSPAKRPLWPREPGSMPRH